MESKILKRILWCLLYLCPVVFALDLHDVYRLALKQDPEFRMAHARYMAEKEELLMTRASLLPSIDVDASLTHSRRQYHGATARSRSTVQTYGVSLTQPLFNAQAWAGLRGAKAHVKQSYATYLAAQQAIIWRSAKRYTDVLVAKTRLRHALAEKKAVTRLLESTKSKHQVGKVAQAEVDEAQAGFDSANAQVIAVKTALAKAHEQLFQLTGRHQKTLKFLPEDLTLLVPKLSKEDKWVSLALAHNNTYKSSVFARDVAKASAQGQQVNRVPVIVASAEYDYTNTHASAVADTIGHGPSVGVAVSMPLFKGGSLSAKQRQTSWALVQARAQLLLARRQVESQARQAYQNVLLGLSKVKADQRTLMSRESALHSVEAAYEVGQRNMTNVLQAQSDWFASNTLLSKDFYFYVMSTLSLKRVAGQLCLADIEALSRQMVDENSEAVPASLVLDAGAPEGSAKRALDHSRRFFTIQLLSSQRELAALRFIRAHDLVHNAHYERLLDGQGQAHFVVLMGQFASKGEAKDALANLPEKLRALRPWVRVQSAPD